MCIRDRPRHAEQQNARHQVPCDSGGKNVTGTHLQTPESDVYKRQHEDRLMLTAADALGFVYGLFEISRRFLGVQPFWLSLIHILARQYGQAYRGSTGCCSTPSQCPQSGWKCAADNPLGLLCLAAPVSYTHLDVYKRQAFVFDTARPPFHKKAGGVCGVTPPAWFH